MGPNTSQTRPEAVAAFALLLLALAASVGGVAYLPTHDGPQHVFTAHAAAHLDAAGTGWSHWLRTNVPATNHGFTALFAPFDAFLDWRQALRIALVLGVLLWAGGAFALVHAIEPARAWLALPLAAAACQWTLYMGFFSFHAASGLGLWVIAFALRRDPTDRALASTLPLAALLLAQALMHVVPAILTGTVLLTLAATRAPKGGRTRALAATVACGLPAAAVALAAVRVGFDALGAYNEGIGSDPTLVRSPWWAIAKCFTAGPAWRAWGLPILAAVGAASVFGLRSRSATERGIAVAGAALLVAAIALPLHLRAWDFFSVRFLPLGVTLLAALVPIERLRAPTLRHATAMALAGWAFAASGWAWQHQRDLAARMAPALAGLDTELVRSGMRLPIVMDAYLGAPEPEHATVPYAVPALNLGALYATSQGGVVPYSFTLNPVLHHALRNQEAWNATPGAVDRRYAIDLARTTTGRDPLFRRAVLAYVAARSTRYEDVILWGSDDDVEALLGMGYEADHRSPGLVIARFVGCEIAVTVDGADAEAALTVGWYPAQQVTHRYPVARGRAVADGTRELRLRQSCGPIWLGFDDPETVCEGADADGRWVIASPRESSNVVCRARGPRLAHR